MSRPRIPLRELAVVVALFGIVVLVAVGGAVTPFGDDTPSETTPTKSATPTTASTPTATPWPDVHSGYDETVVTVVDGETGDRKGAVDAAIADNRSLHVLGLSDTDVLPPDRGMLFVFDTEAERTFVMTNMSFGIDIVFIDADGTITDIYEAPKPAPDEDGSAQGFRGDGQYILEVNKGWMADHGVEVGDRVEFELP